MVLSVLLLGGCTRHVCPDCRVAGGITVDASAFVDAHPRAGKLCVTGVPCLVLEPSHPGPAVVQLAADRPVAQRAAPALLAPVSRPTLWNAVLHYETDGFAVTIDDL